MSNKRITFQNSIVVIDIGAIRALNGVLGDMAVVASAEVHGSYWFDASDTTTGDDGRTCIVATDSGRWKLVVLDADAVEYQSGSASAYRDGSVGATLAQLEAFDAYLGGPSGADAIAFLQGSTNVKAPAFGAKGDDAADDTAAFQAAFNYASTVTDSVLANNIEIGTSSVYIPPGIYRLSDLTIYNAIRIFGASQGSVLLKYIGSGTAINIVRLATESLYAVQFEGFTLVNAGTGQYGIKGDTGTANLAIRACGMRNVTVYGFDTNVLLDECQTFYTDHCVIQNGGSYNARIKNATSVCCLGTRFDVAGVDCVLVEDGATGNESVSPLFISCTFQSAQQWGLHTIDALSVTVINPDAEANNHNASPSYGGIYIADGPNKRTRNVVVQGGFFSPGTGTSGQTAIKIDRAWNVDINTHVRGSGFGVGIVLGANVQGGRLDGVIEGAITPYTYTGDGDLQGTINGRSISANRLVPVVNYGGQNFDGATNWLSANALTGIADSYTGWFAASLRFANAASVTEVIFANTGSRLLVQRTASGNLTISARDSSGTAILAATTAGALLANAGSYTILASWDLRDATKFQVYINQVNVTPTPSPYTNSQIDYTVVEYTVGALPGGTSKFAGDLYQLYFDTTAYINLSLSRVRSRFFSDGGISVYAGNNGRLAIGTQPQVFLAYNGAATWKANLGSLVATTWTQNGAAVNATTPIDGQYGVN